MGLGLKEVAASLLFEADGKVMEAVEYEVAKMQEICKKNNGADLWYSFDAKEREQIFMGRKKIVPRPITV